MKKLMIAVISIALVLSCVLGAAACSDDNAENYLFGKETIKVSRQLDILTGMKTGSADIGVMDSIMAGYYLSNSDFKNTLEVLPFYLSEEEYGIGAKKGNEALISKINEAMIALYKNGTMTEIGETFGLENEILVNDKTTDRRAGATDQSWSKVVSSKKLIIGYTEFAPIAYNENNKFTGYDIELARAVVAWLNETYSTQIEVEFSEINWDLKTNLLNTGSIDLVWNGMTINEERQEGMCLSIPYLSNKQAILIKKADKLKYDLTSLDAFKASASKAIVYVENGSAAADIMILG